MTYSDIGYRLDASLLWDSSAYINIYIFLAHVSSPQHLHLVQAGRRGVFRADALEEVIWLAFMTSKTHRSAEGCMRMRKGKSRPRL